MAAATGTASGVADHVQAHAPCLPPEAEAFFVGEGAANVVFAIDIPAAPSAAEDRNAFQGRLLRVPKAGKGTFSYVEQQAFWESQVKPLFRQGDLVQQSLVRMPDDSGRFVAQLNKILSEKDPERRDDFVGSQVEDVAYGMLVDDMRSNDGDMIREFKPKWLAQSPNAPETAVRCRNCAREALRNVKKGKHVPIFCPLNFLAANTEQSVKVLRYFNLPTTFSPGLSQTKHCYEWLGEENVLKILRNHQLRLDPGGPLNVSAHDASFQLAMTLRDCTVYLQIPKKPGQPICAKLGDLDKKNWDVKLDYWRTMEKDLMDGGFYEARETPPQETDCVLVPTMIDASSGVNQYP